MKKKEKKSGVINVRLDESIEKRLVDYTQIAGLTKSAIVSEALERYLTEERMGKSPFELGEDLFGRAGSGSSNASTTYKSMLKAKLHAKHSH